MINTEAQPVPAELSALRENWQTFKVATWLGWQVEGNWADPIVFFIFSVLRPVASALILLVMYEVVAGGNRGDFFNYLFISNAFFVLVIQALAGMAWVILDDREHYRMLKYIYTSPARKLAYLMGRAVSKVVIGLMTTGILMLMGVLFLGLEIDVTKIQWGWFVVYFILGMVSLLALGLMLAGVALVVARHGEFIGEVTAGCLLLFSAAYFPVDILPNWLQALTMVNPLTYWLEGMRRTISGGILVGSDGQPISPMLAAFDNGQLFAILGITAAITAFLAIIFYNWVEHQAKERGMIDRVSSY